MIEKNDSHLNDIIYTLLNSKVPNREERVKLIENILKELESIDAFTLDEIKNILNYLIIEMDFGMGIRDSHAITPDSIKDLMVGLIEPIEGIKVADYFSGLGSILLKVNKAYKAYKDYNIESYGEEINNETYLFSQILYKTENQAIIGELGMEE